MKGSQRRFLSGRHHVLAAAVMPLLFVARSALAFDDLSHDPFVSAMAPVAPPAAAPPQNRPVPTPPQNNYLLLQLVINDTEMEDVTEALQKDGRLYLPLGQICQILDFPITADAVTPSAQGWFIREQNTFLLDSRSARVKGKSIPVAPGALFPKDNDLYVDAVSLEAWFPLVFKVDMRRMTLDITTRETLPFQTQKLRDKAHRRLAEQNQPAKDETFRKVQTPYAGAEWPVVDLTAGSSYDNTGHNTRTNYAALAVGDFGYLTSRLYAAGDLGKDNVSDLRASFGRDDYENNLLGAAHASSFRFGDIESASLSQVMTSTQGRGATVTNRALDRPDTFDLTNFTGDAKPGWEAELYRNGALIAFQTVGTDGRYAFLKIPVLFGNNQFRIAFYGPQGQVEEVTKTINAQGALLEKGQLTYQFSADQKNKTLFGLSQQNGSQPTGLAGSGELEYGVSKGLTLAAGAAHTILRDGDHSYATAGVRTSVDGFLVALDNAYDATNHGYSTRFALSGDLHDTLLSFQQKVSRDFESEENDTQAADLLNRQTVARADKEFNAGPIDNLSASLSYTRNQYASGREETLWANSLSRPFFSGISVTNTLKSDSDNRGLDQFTGETFLRGDYHHALLGAQLNYELRPVSVFDAVRLEALYPLSSAISDNLALTSQLNRVKTNTLENTVTFDMSRYKLSFTGRASDRGDIFAGLTLNMSIGRVPDTGQWLLSGKRLAETGIVDVRPYIDQNYNQRFDPDEQAPPHAVIKVGSQTLKLDSRGEAIAMQMPVNMPVKVALEQDTLTSPSAQEDNPLWAALVDAYTVTPRPGKIIVLDYPLVETSQIDGTVSVPAGKSAAGLPVELVSAEGQGVRTAHTAFDGYYLLENVMPGSYTVRIAAESLASRGLRQAQNPAMTIGSSDVLVKDIRLEDAAAAPVEIGSPPVQPKG